MKLFSGFPSGKLQVTPLPNLFFSELLPAIDDLAELKVTLHAFWLLATRKNRALYVTAAELRADRTLVQSLAALDAKPDEALTRALALAAERGTLLRLSASGDELYFLNSEAGRRAFERVGAGSSRPDTGGTDTPEPAVIAARPDIFHLYEKNIGLLTPMISEELKDAEKEYPAEWIPEAFKIAVENNKRSWSYVRKILERWQVEGRGAGLKKGKTWYGDEYGKFVKR
ncbi:MAG: DnaD domain protein [Chloroflexi bacterium]|nr:DnaD domain protein [Chloroflexota bacterium]